MLHHKYTHAHAHTHTHTHAHTHTHTHTKRLTHVQLHHACTAQLHNIIESKIQSRIQSSPESSPVQNPVQSSPGFTASQSRVQVLQSPSSYCQKILYHVFFQSRIRQEKKSDLNQTRILLAVYTVIQVTAPIHE